MKKTAAELRSQLMILSASVAVGVSVIGVCLRSYREDQINSLLQISKQAFFFFCRQVGNRQEISELLYLEFLCHPVHTIKKRSIREVGDPSCLVMIYECVLKDYSLSL